MMYTLILRGAASVLVMGLLCVGTVMAQDEAATTQPTSAPADREPVQATVIEVQGDVQYAALGSTDWKSC